MSGFFEKRTCKSMSKMFATGPIANGIGYMYIDDCTHCVLFFLLLQMQYKQIARNVAV